MTFDDFRTIALGMRTVYTKDNFLNSPEEVKIWYQLLGDLPYEVLNIAVQKYMTTERFPPTTADLRKITTELTEDVPSDWGHGWEQVRNAIRRYGTYDSKGALDSMDEVTRAVVTRMGWQEICLSENMEVDRANFRMIYEQLAKKETERMQLSPKLQEQLSKLQLMQEETKMLTNKEEDDDE